MTDDKFSRRPEVDPIEVNYLQSEIAKDIAAGDGAKHFEDVLDSIHSTQGDAGVTIDPITEERTKREITEIRRQLKIDLTKLLLPHSMICKEIIVDVNGKTHTWDGFRIRFIDSERREFHATITFDETIKYGETNAERPIYDYMVRTVMARALDERSRHLARVKSFEVQ